MSVSNGILQEPEKHVLRLSLFLLTFHLGFEPFVAETTRGKVCYCESLRHLDAVWEISNWFVDSPHMNASITHSFELKGQ